MSFVYGLIGIPLKLRSLTLRVMPTKQRFGGGQRITFVGLA